MKTKPIERAKELMPEVRDAMHQFVALNLAQAMHNIVEELGKTRIRKTFPKRAV